ncbi:hypothetical protein THAOC_11042 [Thalassiosira oceanica]|uniref:Uncharacterized protein n=1 Tax=Thalassiosira oceanica TaxID=159749 RepID=K0T3B8_THAOC|nr:hypothetical protein THAOC_11042 [Thalassiosira oceanica]|eukprot:EJK67861.1 hypothetical protein THAOC_11042 [Thalassiosira oceanica]
MQHALSSKLKGRVALNKGVHDALDDFRWILTDIASRPTRIAELVPLLASAEGHHDASGKGAGGIWFPANQLNPRQAHYRQAGYVHLEALAQTFDVRERTLLSKTDNLNTLFWQRKAAQPRKRYLRISFVCLGSTNDTTATCQGSTTSLASQTRLLMDQTLQDFTLTWDEQMEVLAPHLPAPRGYQIWTPTEELWMQFSGPCSEGERRLSLIVEPSQPAPAAPVACPPSGSLTLASAGAVTLLHKKDPWQ